MVFLYVQLDFTINKNVLFFCHDRFFVGKCAIASPAHRLFVAWYTSWDGLGSWRNVVRWRKGNFLAKRSLMQSVVFNLQAEAVMMEGEEH